MTTLTVCRHCGRDLPAGSHHRLRYCPDRPCRHEARLGARKKRRRAAKPAAGSTRKFAGRRVVYAPGHPLDCGSGFVGVNRVELYEQSEGVDPRCATCRVELDWLAPSGDDRRVCAVRATDGVLALCHACLVGVNTAGTLLGCHLHPLTWASAGESYGAPVEDGGPHRESRPAVRITDDLPAALSVLSGVWDGSVDAARLLAAAATVLELVARTR